MRFEPPRIRLNAREAFLPKFSSQAHRAIFFDVPVFTLRKLRLKRSGAALIVRPPEQLRPVQDDVEPRPTGFAKYGRHFTREGGIELRYNDVERTLPIILAKLALWLSASLLTYALGKLWSPIDGFWWNTLAYIVFIVVYGVVFFRDQQVERRIEISPDCMIIDGMDTFWKENMQLGWPGFMPDDAGNFVLCGVYGSRWIEFLTIRRFDQNDRAPELFATHLAAAMQYQWELPSKGV